VPVAAITALMTQCWALSALLFYWVLFGWLYKRLMVRALSLRSTLAVLTGIWCIPCVILTMLVLFDIDIEVRSLTPCRPLSTQPQVPEFSPFL
jgi:O-antigen ligase